MVGALGHILRREPGWDSLETDHHLQLLEVAKQMEVNSVVANGVTRGNSHELGCRTVRMDIGEVLWLEGLWIPGTGTQRGQGSHPHHLAR